MTDTSESRYDTTVLSIGSMVEQFVAMKMLIIFAEGAPAELHDICVVHRPEVRTGGVRAGDRLLLNDVEYPILAVGDLADQNLRALGHVSFKANGLHAAPLPGDICLEEVDLPLPEIGSRIQIVSGGPATTEELS